MKIKKIIHKDGSVSFVTDGIEIIKNKEDRKDQKIIEIEAKSVEEETRKEKDKNGKFQFKKMLTDKDKK